jgi:SHS2 domain-containing protein
LDVEDVEDEALEIFYQVLNRHISLNTTARVVSAKFLKSKSKSLWITAKKISRSLKNRPYDAQL